MEYEMLHINGEDADYIDDRIVEYNLSKMPAERENGRVVKWFGRKVINDDGRIIGGCVALRTVWNTAEVSALWVDEKYRNRKIGTDLLYEVEREAKENGCTVISLDTFDWQAKEFYEKNGYFVFGELKDCPMGHSRYYMSKFL